MRSISARGINAELTGGRQRQDVAGLRMNLNPNFPLGQSAHPQMKAKLGSDMLIKAVRHRTPKQHLEFQWRNTNITIHKKEVGASPM